MNNLHLASDEQNSQKVASYIINPNRKSGLRKKVQRTSQNYNLHLFEMSKSSVTSGRFPGEVIDRSRVRYVFRHSHQVFSKYDHPAIIKTASSALLLQLKKCRLPSSCVLFTDRAPLSHNNRGNRGIIGSLNDH